MGQKLKVVDALTPAAQQVIEEVKASFVHFWFDKIMTDNGLMSEEQRKQNIVAGVIWSFGHVMRKLYDDAGSIKPYSAVGAMILGAFMKDGAMTYNKKTQTWDINFKKAAKVAEKMFKKILIAQATGNGKVVQEMIDYYTKDKKLLEFIRYDDIVDRAIKENFKPGTTMYQVVIDD